MAGNVALWLIRLQVRDMRLKRDHLEKVRAWEESYRA